MRKSFPKRRYSKINLHKTDKLDENTFRIIKINRDGVFEFLYEGFISKMTQLFNVDLEETKNKFMLDDDGNFIFAVTGGNDEDENGNFITFPEEINMNELIKKIPETTDSVLAGNSKHYREYTKEQLIDI